MNRSGVDSRITAKLICDLMNGVEEIELEILDFYTGYIKTAAWDRRDIAMLGGDYSEDLEQEMKMGLFKSIPVFREKLLKQYSSKSIIMTIH